MKPIGSTIDEQRRYIGKDTGTQTATLVEVDFVAQFAPLPLGVIEILGHGRKAAVGQPTAAAVDTDEQHATQPPSVDHAAVKPFDHIALPNFGYHSG